MFSTHCFLHTPSPPPPTPSPSHTRQSNEEGLVLVTEALKASGHQDKVKIAMDCAASEFYSECC